jgi:hypothetical protein
MKILFFKLTEKEAKRFNKRIVLNFYIKFLSIYNTNIYKTYLHITNFKALLKDPICKRKLGIKLFFI